MCLLVSSDDVPLISPSIVTMRNILEACENFEKEVASWQMVSFLL